MLRNFSSSDPHPRFSDGRLDGEEEGRGNGGGENGGTDCISNYLDAVKRQPLRQRRANQGYAHDDDLCVLYEEEEEKSMVGVVKRFSRSMMVLVVLGALSLSVLYLTMEEDSDSVVKLLLYNNFLGRFPNLNVSEETERRMLPRSNNAIARVYATPSPLEQFEADDDFLTRQEQIREARTELRKWAWWAQKHRFEKQAEKDARTMVQGLDEGYYDRQGGVVHQEHHFARLEAGWKDKTFAIGYRNEIENSGRSLTQQQQGEGRRHLRRAEKSHRKL